MDNEIYEISNEDFVLLKQNWTENKKIPKKLFFTKLDDDFYLGMDNEHGSCFVEELDSKNRVICWLIRTDYSSLEINRLSDIEVNRLLNGINYNIIDKTSNFNYEI